MLRIIAERLHQKHRTFPFPDKEPTFSPRFKGMPVLRHVPPDLIDQAMDVCPTGALICKETDPQLDMGRCLFCGECERVAPKFITFTNNYRVASFSRKGLLIHIDQAHPVDEKTDDSPESITPESIRKLFKRSFRIREISAGGCNACDADCNVLGTLVYDLTRFGIDFVASPRHADALLITGPVPRNMHFALQKTYEAMPAPKVVIALGACAISGGLFHDMGQEAMGASPHLPIDLYIPGCPPNPYTILASLLQFIHII